MKNRFGNPKNILAVRLGAMGDVIHVIPAVKNLRTAYPNAHISWLVEDKLKDLVDGVPEIDEVVVFPRKQWQSLLKHPLNYSKLIAEVLFFMKKLRARKYDIVFDFHGNFKSGLLTFFSNAKARVGFSRGFCKEFNYIFTNIRITPQQKRIHRIHKYLSLLEGVGITTHYQRSVFSIPDTDRNYIHNFIYQNCLHQKPLAIIHPGTSVFGKFKRWPARNYAILADRLIQELGYSVLFTWGTLEYTMMEEIVSLMRNKATIACKTSSVKQLIALLHHAHLYVGGDTGPTHIASTIGIPTVAIFGPKDPVVYAPQGENAVVVRKNIPCSPCEKRSCRHITCITAVTTDDVFRAVCTLTCKRSLTF